MESSFTQKLSKTIVKKVRNKYIIAYNSSISVKSPIFKENEYQKLLHEFGYRHKSPISFINNFIKNPLDILALEGSKKINILLFMAFIGEKILPNFDSLKISQNVLFNLLKFKKEEWTSLLIYDINTFIALENHLKVDVFEKLGLDEKIEVILDALDIRQIKRQSLDLQKYQNFIKWLKISENEFFKPKIKKYVNIIDDYKNAINYLKKGRIGKRLFNIGPFHSELNILNDYILSRGNLDYFNEDLLNREFATNDEKIIVEFIKNKLKEQAKIKQCK